MLLPVNVKCKKKRFISHSIPEGFPVNKGMLDEGENLICATLSEEEQCVLLLSRQAQTHACRGAALAACFCQDWATFNRLTYIEVLY